MKVKRKTAWYKRMFSVLAVLVLTINICCTQAGAILEPGYVSIDTAIGELRSAMASREANFTLYVISQKNLLEDGAVTKLIFYPAIRGDTPGEYASSGDYLKKVWNGHSHRVTSVGTNMWQIDFIDMKYRTTAEQEEIFAQELDRVLESLDLEGKSDYLKCRKIYEYICASVAYDDESYAAHREGDSTTHNLSYTAYPALIEGKAVCSGYAHLFYAMCHSVGIPVRIVRGTAQGKNGWESHAWNIVKLGDKWYQLDCTWDSGDKPSDWKYFLKGTKTFQKHKLAEEFLVDDFALEYPLSVTSYNPAMEYIKRLAHLRAGLFCCL